MGFMRKALFLGTGGLSGAAGIKANSKKERTAKAAEKQLRLQKQVLKAQQAGAKQATTARPAAQRTIPRSAVLQAGVALYNVRCPKCAAMVRLPAGDHRTCPECGTQMSVVPVARQPAAPLQTAATGTTSELERLAKLHSSGALTDEVFAAAKTNVLNHTVCAACGHTNTGQPRRCTKCGTDL